MSASGKDGRTPAMRRLFAKRAHCKWHNIAPPERRRIGSTCARVPKVSSRNRGCPFRGYGCGGNPQEGGATLPCQRNKNKHPLNGDILMKNKKEPRIPDAPCTCPYISGRERGSDAEFTPSKNQEFLDGDPKLPKFVAERRYSDEVRESPLIQDSQRTFRTLEV